MTPDHAPAPDVGDALRSAPGFDTLPDDARRELTAEASALMLEAGQALLDHGRFDTDLYLLVSGGLTVTGPNGTSPEMTL